MFVVTLLVVIYLAFISLGLPDALLGSAWPVMYKDLNVSVESAGVITMIVAGGTIVSSFFSDNIIRKFGTGVVTLISVLLTAIALVLISFTTSFYVLCGLAIVLGVGAGSVDAALNNYVALNYKAKHMSWLHCFWGVGAMTGPLIMSNILTNGQDYSIGYRTVSYIQFGLVFILLISLPLWKKVSSNSQNNDNSENIEQVVISKKDLLKLLGAKPALVAFFCYCAMEATLGLWGSSYMVLVHGVTVEKAARYGSLFYFGITFGRFLAGFITSKFSNKQLVYIGQMFIAIGVILIVLPIGVNTALIGFILAGFGCAPIYPSLLHETPKNFGAEYSQSIMGVQMASAYVGATFAPLIFGFIAKYLTYSILPFYIGLILLLMVSMVVIVNKKVTNNIK